MLASIYTVQGCKRKSGAKPITSGMRFENSKGSLKRDLHQRTVVAFGVALSVQPAVGAEVLADRFLEMDFPAHVHAVAPNLSSMRLLLSDATPAGALFDPGKQRKGKPIKPVLIEWTDELRRVWKESASTRVGAVPLFPTAKGTHYSRDSFQSIWQRWRKKIPIADLRWHDIRRKTGSDSATDADASERLNHADEAITKAHYRAKLKRVKPLR